jgi:Right handed beta helix region
MYVYHKGGLLRAVEGGPSSAEAFIAHPRPGPYSVLVVPVRVVTRLFPSQPTYGGIARLVLRPGKPTEEPVRRVPRSIAGDCSRDVTAQLLAWIARAPNYSTLLFGKNACYRIDGTLLIQDRWGLVFWGNGATFRAGTEGDPERRHWWFWGGGDHVIRDMTVIGANPFAGLAPEAYRPDREFQHAFFFAGVQGALLDNVRAFDVYGDFVCITLDIRAETGQPWSRNIIVQKSHFERNGRQGITIGAGEDILIRWNYLGEVRRSTFDIEPSTPNRGARRVTLYQNVTGPGKLLWLANGGVGSNVSEINIVGNVMLQNGAGILVAAADGSPRGPFLLENNNFIGGGAPIATFTKVSGVTIRNNWVWYNPLQGAPVVRLHTSSAVRVMDNAFPGAGMVFEADPGSFDYLEYNNSTDPAPLDSSL